MFRHVFGSLTREIGKVVVGHAEIVRGVLICLFSGGHTLLEGVPGLGKTLLVKTLAESLDLHFSRIQFTPDLMPADIVGTNIVVETPGGRHFGFQRGPIFGQIVLADEVNRATPKTQSALLEGMQELSVTVGGTHHALGYSTFSFRRKRSSCASGNGYVPSISIGFCVARTKNGRSSA